MKLYSYWRSTTSYRVRIALNLKGIAYKDVSVDLVAGAQRDAGYKALNPIAGVPTLVLDDGTALTQSMAILRYLEAAHPNPALLPQDPVEAAKIEAAAMVIATDIHPVDNLKVVQHLKSMGHGPQDTQDWMNHWMREGLMAFAKLTGDGPYCFGETPSLADICLIPQLYNAHRWGTDLLGLEHLLDIENHCLKHQAFEQARPENQPDAKKD